MKVQDIVTTRRQGAGQLDLKRVPRVVVDDQTHGQGCEGAYFRSALTGTGAPVRPSLRSFGASPAGFPP